MKKFELDCGCLIVIDEDGMHCYYCDKHPYVYEHVPRFLKFQRKPILKRRKA